MFNMVAVIGESGQISCDAVGCRAFAKHGSKMPFPVVQRHASERPLAARDPSQHVPLAFDVTSTSATRPSDCHGEKTRSMVAARVVGAVPGGAPSPDDGAAASCPAPVVSDADHAPQPHANIAVMRARKIKRY